MLRNIIVQQQQQQPSLDRNNNNTMYQTYSDTNINDYSCESPKDDHHHQYKLCVVDFSWAISSSLQDSHRPGNYLICANVVESLLLDA